MHISTCEALVLPAPDLYIDFLLVKILDSQMLGGF